LQEIIKIVRNMGMFDSVRIKMKCPYCGESSIIEAQTKELECNLEEWKVGDFVTDKVDHLVCIADCVQPKCKEFVTKKNGHWGGFGRMFDVKIFLKDGKVSGEYEVLRLLDADK
jgi:hypothetical protein